MAAYSPLFKEANLTQDQAQKLVSAYEGSQTKAREAIQAKWATDAKADKEFGGAKFDASSQVAKTAMGRFASPEFVTFLNETGLGNHPEMVRMFYRIGSSIAPDKLPPMRASTGAQATKARLNYDHPSSAQLKR